MIVDGITAIGAMDFKMDEMGDRRRHRRFSEIIMYRRTFIYCSIAQSLCKNGKAGMPRFYFDLNREIKSLSKLTTAWTPAISLFRGLNRALKMMKEEGPITLSVPP